MVVHTWFRYLHHVCQKHHLHSLQRVSRDMDISINILMLEDCLGLRPWSAQRTYLAILCGIDFLFSCGRKRWKEICDEVSPIPIYSPAEVQLSSAEGHSRWRHGTVGNMFLSGLIGRELQMGHGIWGHAWNSASHFPPPSWTASAPPETTVLVGMEYGWHWIMALSVCPGYVHDPCTPE